MASDPSVRAAERADVPHFDFHQAAPLVTVNQQPKPSRESRRARVFGVYAVLAVATAALTMRLLASLVATPLDTANVGAAPTWSVEVTTTGNMPATGLIYGPDVGFQLVQIPAGNGAGSSARVIPARLAKGEVHLISLSFTSLRVRGSVTNGASPILFEAVSPIITAYQTKDATGVRARW